MDRAGAFQPVEESLAERRPLQSDGGDQEIKCHGAVAVLLQKGHQEAETDEHHDVDILEHYAKQKAIKYKNSNRPKKN